MSPRPCVAADAADGWVGPGSLTGVVPVVVVESFEVDLVVATGRAALWDGRHVLEAPLAVEFEEVTRGVPEIHERFDTVACPDLMRRYPESFEPLL